jgi:hypothetical protein
VLYIRNLYIFTDKYTNPLINILNNNISLYIYSAHLYFPYVNMVKYRLYGTTGQGESPPPIEVAQGEAAESCAVQRVSEPV